MKTISILGTVGIPASYGGFESLVENLARFHQANKLSSRLVVYCSAKSYKARPKICFGAELRYVRLNANGASSIVYDIVSLISAVWNRSDVILLLGVSGAIALPFVRILSQAKIVTNIDGLEWKREKWKGLARCFLKFSERIAVTYSHEVVADNAGIAEHVTKNYGKSCHVIAYGGDHAIKAKPKAYTCAMLPNRYALALCRIEPENNVQMILEAFFNQEELPLVFIGNWNNSSYGKELRERFGEAHHLFLLDPIYDAGVLNTLRSHATAYVHGHSAGGTNPSLVEMMHFGHPILAYDCVFNRYSTDSKAIWFNNSIGLSNILRQLNQELMEQVGTEMKKIAQKRYTWSAIGNAYFKLLLEDISY